MQCLDTRQDDIQAKLEELRERLSPRGDVVSEEGRQLTKTVFGESLSPQQVVERICGDVHSQGLDAVLEYTRKLDKADLTRATVQVNPR